MCLFFLMPYFVFNPDKTKVVCSFIENAPLTENKCAITTDNIICNQEKSICYKPNVSLNQTFGEQEPFIYQYHSLISQYVHGKLKLWSLIIASILIVLGGCIYIFDWFQPNT